MATALVGVHLRTLYDGLETVGANPGVVAGSWDKRTVDIVLAVGKRITTTCVQIEGLLLDLDDDILEKVANIVARARAIANSISSLEKHDEQTAISVADYITRKCHERANALLEEESYVMGLLGVKDQEKRLRLPRNPRPGDEV